MAATTPRNTTDRRFAEEIAAALRAGILAEVTSGSDYVMGAWTTFYAVKTDAGLVNLREEFARLHDTSAEEG